jgi:nitrogen regulatory protein P-II 1
MKLIRGIIHPDKVHQVREALNHLAVSWLTTSHVADHNPSKPHTMAWRGHCYDVGAARIEIEVAVDDDDVDHVVDVIIKTARTGELDDGYVSVIPVDERYEIRTGRRAVS